MRRSKPAANGVLVLGGYGIRVFVERGHLCVEDGFAAERRRLRFARIDRDLRRLVVIGHTGSVSFEALRWLQDVGVAFVQVDRDGQLVVAAGSSGPHLPALRRAQALAATSGAGVGVIRELLLRKILGQAEILERLPAGPLVLPQVRALVRTLPMARTATQFRALEAQVAAAYWSAWQAIPVRFVARDRRRVPAHWRAVGSRSSVLTSSPRRATNPANALLNYGYAILEAEAQIGTLAMGLDPAVGLLHADQRGRDSFACDVMEAVRPVVDSWALELLASHVFDRQDFVETPEGGCRLMPALARLVAETAPEWAKVLAPVVEAAARMLVASLSPSPASEVAIADKVDVPPRHRADRNALPTPLTQRQRREGRRAARQRRELALVTEDVSPSRNQPTEDSLSAVSVPSEPAPFSPATFLRVLQPTLRRVAMDRLAQETGLSRSYCARIRGGSCVPHRRHWKAFQRIVEAELRGPKSIG